MNRYRVTFWPDRLDAEVEAEDDDAAMDQAMPLLEQQLFNGGSWEAERLNEEPLT